MISADAELEDMPPGIYDALLLRIHVIGIRPPVWRSIVVHPCTDLSELHRLICALLGWDEASEHLFGGKATNANGKGSWSFTGKVGNLECGNIIKYSNLGPGGRECRISVTRKGLRRSSSLPLLVGGMRVLGTNDIPAHEISTPAIDMKLRSFRRYDELIPDEGGNLVEHWRATALSSSDDLLSDPLFAALVRIGKVRKVLAEPLLPVANKVPPGTPVELKIKLMDMPVPVWRQMLVDSAITFHCLHECIQAAFGWEDCHLYCFPVGDSLIQSFMEDDITDLPHGTETVDSMSIRLRDIMTGKGWFILYNYDFGDGWRHQVKVVKVHEGRSPLHRPELLRGKGACPPEDCGGSFGYIELIDALNDPQHPEHGRMVEFMGVSHLDPSEFDLKDAQSRLRSARLMDV